MAEQEPNQDDELIEGLPEGTPVGDGAAEEEIPRREASAEFVISADAGSEAAIREAMDPANQSFADALRLSFRILQLGILALVAVFLFSGFQTVEEGDLGVKTRFGAIVGTPGLEQVGPGLHPFWPYPVGEVIIVPQTREVELLRAFWPLEKNARKVPNPKRAGIDESRSENEQLRAGVDGYLMTSDGDLAHCEVRASYAIDDAASFLRELSPEQADLLVKNALERGVVLVAATFTLNEFIDLREEPAEHVRQRAQQTLDELDSGIELLDVRLDQRTAPLAIRAQYRDVQKAREDAKELIDRAHQEVAKEFTAVAGEQAYSDLINMINEYSSALTSGDDEVADEVLSRIGKRFVQDDVGGDSARIINQARAYQSALETRLGSELRRIQTLAPTYKENPREFSRRLWLETYRDVFDNSQLEVFSVPLNLSHLDLAIQSSEDVMQLRRDAELERKKASARDQELKLIQGFQWGRSQIILEGPGRRLERDASGGLGRENDK
jgi:regulator of protease activity HflC (stomatin/prohibitin superfamily)